MRAHGRGPVAEAIMVLGGDDHAGDASRFHHAHPLSRIKRGGCERGGRFVAVTPFAVREGVWSKVDEPREFHVLPCPLRRRRYGCNRWQRRGGCGNHGKLSEHSEGEGGGGHYISLWLNLRAELATNHDSPCSPLRGLWWAACTPWRAWTWKLCVSREATPESLPVIT